MTQPSVLRAPRQAAGEPRAGDAKRPSVHRCLREVGVARSIGGIDREDSPSEAASKREVARREGRARRESEPIHIELRESETATQERERARSTSRVEQRNEELLRAEPLGWESVPRKLFFERKACLRDRTAPNEVERAFKRSCWNAACESTHGGEVVGCLLEMSLSTTQSCGEQMRKRVSGLCSNDMLQEVERLARAIHLRHEQGNLVSECRRRWSAVEFVMQKRGRILRATDNHEHPSKFSTNARNRRSLNERLAETLLGAHGVLARHQTARHFKMTCRCVIERLQSEEVRHFSGVVFAELRMGTNEHRTRGLAFRILAHRCFERFDRFCVPMHARQQ